MAAYAALVSLINTLNNIKINPRVSTFFPPKQIASLISNAGLLLDFAENFDSHGCSSKEAENLEAQIVYAAHTAEDVIESQIVDLIESGSTPLSLIDLHELIEDSKSLAEKAKNIKEETTLKDQQPTYSKSVATSRSLSSSGKKTMVGFDGYLIQLLDLLTGQQYDRQIIPITGMGGIGKTTLARNAYENLLTVENFDVRAWVTVSQEYNVREIILQTLYCLRGFTSYNDEITEDELGEALYKILFDRRYLVVLDDIWSVEAWERIRPFFPENVNRSRIVVTTRQSDVSNYFGSFALALSFLDDDRSWDLFCEKAFAKEGCPNDLEQIGRKIVKKCRGLPLAIVVIGGLLGKSSKTHEYWETVENDLSSIVSSGEDNQCFNVLSLSYSHLTPCLKPCYLYLGIFPEDVEINVSQLIKLWVSEGFILPNAEQSLEEVAEGYMKDLVDRNLILVRKLSLNGKLKTCGIHDLLRDLCLRVAEKEKFFCVVRELDAPRDMDSERRIILHESIEEKEEDTEVSLKSARSVISQDRCEVLFKPRLLRVMFGARGYLSIASLGISFQKVNLRFLVNYSHGEFTFSRGNYKLPSSVSLLWNLQTLNLKNTNALAPSEIWEMPQLRHLICRWIILPDPPSNDEQDSVVLQNLQTLKRVRNLRCGVEVYTRMPNIRKLRIDLWYGSEEEDWESPHYCHYNLACLNKLESLLFRCDLRSNRDDLLQNLRFPSSLKKLTLGSCNLHWDHMTMIGSLPHLEVLKLEYSFRGTEWNPVEGEFCCLKYLRISICAELVSWNADKSHFPVLEKLFLQSMFNLEEIPLGIGDIDTLENISLRACTVSAAISALRILEEQESLGNEGLQVQAVFGMQKEMEEFRKEVELQNLSFPRHNFQVSNIDLSYGGIFSS